MLAGYSSKEAHGQTAVSGTRSGAPDISLALASSVVRKMVVGGRLGMPRTIPEVPSIDGVAVAAAESVGGCLVGTGLFAVVAANAASTVVGVELVCENENE